MAAATASIAPRQYKYDLSLGSLMFSRQKTVLEKSSGATDLKATA